MSPRNTGMTDAEGRKLIPTWGSDPFRHKPVWAAFKFRRDRQRAETRSSEFSDLATAKSAVDTLNSNRPTGENSHFFKVYRFAAQPSEPGPALLCRID